MMLYRNVLNFLRGSVQVEIECACPERAVSYSHLTLPTKVLV